MFLILGKQLVPLDQLLQRAAMWMKVVMKKVETGVTIGIVLLCTVFVAACATPDITISSPKVYSDAQTRKILDQNRQGLGTGITTIQGASLQEVRGIREALQNQINISGGTTTAHTAAAPGQITSTTPVGLPSAPSAPSGLGLGFQSLLRKELERRQLIMGLQALYLGDQEALDSDHDLILMRFDASVNSYMYVQATDIWGYPKYARIAFEVTSYSGNDNDELLEDENGEIKTSGEIKKLKEMGIRKSGTPAVKIYHLMPDYSSVVAQESYISSQLDSLSAAAAGLTGNTLLQGAGSSQGALEESLLSTMEEPIQFAIYASGNDKHANRFGFAFGPTREITQRALINPMRLFVTKYKISYVLEPGPRELYALAVVPCRANKIVVKYVMAEDLSNENFSHDLKMLDPNDGSDDEEDGWKPSKLFTYKISRQAGDHCGGPNTIDKQKKRVEIFPNTLYPSQTNTLTISSPEPISSDAQVSIGQVAISPSNISVINRYQLQITVPPNDLLKALTKSTSTKPLTGTISSAGAITTTSAPATITVTASRPITITGLGSSGVISGSPTIMGSGTISGNTLIAGSFTGTLPTSKPIEGTGTLNGPGNISINGEVNISGEGTYSQGQDSCTGTISTSIQPSNGVASGTITSSSGAITIYGEAIDDKGSTISGEGTFTGLGTFIGNAPITLTGNGSITCQGTVMRAGIATPNRMLPGRGAVSAVGTITAVGLISGTGTVSAVGPIPGGQAITLVSNDNPMKIIGSSLTINNPSIIASSDSINGTDATSKGLVTVTDCSPKTIPKDPKVKDIINGCDNPTTISATATLDSTGQLTGHITIVGNAKIRIREKTCEGIVTAPGTFNVNGAFLTNGTIDLLGFSNNSFIGKMTGSSTFKPTEYVQIAVDGTITCMGSITGETTPPHSHETLQDTIKGTANTTFKSINSLGTLTTVGNIRDLTITTDKVNVDQSKIGSLQFTPAPPSSPCSRSTTNSQAPTPAAGTACLLVKIPGVTGISGKEPYLTAELGLADGPAAPSPYVIDPTFGGPQREVTLKLSDPSVDLTKATAVKVGSEDAFIIDNSKPDQIKFLVPLLLNNPTLPTVTSIKVFLPLPQKDFVDGIFTYFPSSPQVQKISVSP